MQKKFVTFLLTAILFCAGISNTHAAFPAKETTSTGTGDETPAAKKSFHETKAAKLFSQAKHAMHPQPYMSSNGQKPGWPGIVSLVCALLAIGSLFLIALAPFSLLFALLAIIFGAIGLSSRRYSNNGLALAGLIIGAVEILLAIALVAIIVSAFK